jgi:hypothetical protein
LISIGKVQAFQNVHKLLIPLFHGIIIKLSARFGKQSAQLHKMQVISITQWSGRRVTAAVRCFNQIPQHCRLSQQVQACSQDMNELRYTKPFQASLYKQQSMLPL